MFSSVVFSTPHRFGRWCSLALLIALLLSALPREGVRATPHPNAGFPLPLPLLLKTTLKTAASPAPVVVVPHSVSAAPTLSPPAAPSARPLSVGFYGFTESNTRIPAKGNFVIRGTARLEDSKHKVYDELCLHRANLTFAWNDEDFESVHPMGRFGGCADACAYEYYFGDNDHHTRNEDYRVFDRLGTSWYASTGYFSLSPPHIWEVLPHDPPPGFAEGWDVEVRLPSRASTLITYTHAVGVLPTHVLT